MAKAVKFAVTNSIPMTACCGGHSSTGASSSAGMVIDLSKLRAIQVDTAAMTISFGGGCLWTHVDKALEQHGLATVGGVVDHTGVGGLILGGGHGWLTPLHGLSIDNLISAQVVLGDGSIIEASDKENQDLFWALRGAGAQFGIVTRFVSHVHKQDKVWSGTLAYTADKLPELVDAANEVHDKDRGEGHCMAVGIGYAPDGVTRGLSAIPLYHGSAADGEKYFSKLLEVQSVARDTGMMSTARVNTLLNPVFGHGMRRMMGSANVTMPIDAAALQQTAGKFWEFCETHGGSALGTSCIALELFPTDKVRAVPQGATAYANRGAYYDAITAFGWVDAATDADVKAFNKALCEQIRQTNGRPVGVRKDDGVGMYVNVEADKVAPEDGYGGNLARLREVKKRYDPGNVFTKGNGIGA